MKLLFRLLTVISWGTFALTFTPYILFLSVPVAIGLYMVTGEWCSPQIQMEAGVDALHWLYEKGRRS